MRASFTIMAMFMRLTESNDIFKTEAALNGRGLRWKDDAYTTLHRCMVAKCVENYRACPQLFQSMSNMNMTEI